MYKDLPLSDRARIIQMAVQSGITDLRTIEDVYNKFVTGGKLDELTDEAIARATNSGLLEPSITQYASGGKIHIKKENRGKFTALKKRTGHSASWFKAHGTPAQRKMATFALNARKWHH